MSDSSKGDAPVTLQSLLEASFEAIPEFRARTKKERVEHAHEKVEGLRPFAVLASELLAQHKDEMIKTASKSPETFVELMEGLNEASKDADALAQLLCMARSRLMVAIAFCGGDDDGGGVPLEIPLEEAA